MSLAEAIRPPLIQKEVTLETVTPHSENLETDETNETVFLRKKIRKWAGNWCEIAFLRKIRVQRSIFQGYSVLLWQNGTAVDGVNQPS